MKSIIYILIIGQLLFLACRNNEINAPGHIVPVMDLDHIQEKGRIVAVTDYNSSNYFIYKGKPMGFQFELLEDFADHIGIELEIKVKDRFDDKLDMLNDHECDIIAVNKAVTPGLDTSYSFTLPHSKTRQVLIQRRNEKWGHGMFVNHLEELAQKTVYISKEAGYVNDLAAFFSGMGDTIYIREVDEPAETLIKWVANGRIDYMVCYENIALINKAKHKNLHLEHVVSEGHDLAWVVRGNSPELLAFINNWLTEYKKTAKYHVLYRKYFVNGNTVQYYATSDYSTFGAGKMSVYDNAIRKYSEDIGWDWKLLASLIYQESRFNPNVKSWAGAFGIMQLMPGTAQRFGVDTTSGPEEHIKAGVRFLKWLDKRLEDEIPDTDERIKFMLASYNVGFGHVQDARRLARKHGMDPNVWKGNVEVFLLKKSKPEYYTDSVVQHGYCRGTETFNYVNEIIERYHHYSNLYVEN
jgi:membrane-bound lytic murein transglycosylase F